jgi:Ca2+-binding EF-hand superfamily protein
MLGLLASFTCATDFSQMSTEEMINMRGSVPVNDRPNFQQEMQKRMQSMSPEERQKYKQKNKGMSQRSGGQNCMKNLPTFEQFDLNGDGKITQAELEEARAKRMSEKAKEGKMLKNAGKAPAFTDMDLNKDGILDEKEFSAHQAQRIQACQNAKDANNCPSKGKMKGRNMVTFEEIDTNKDGMISKEEFSAHQAQRTKSYKKCVSDCPKEDKKQ